MSPPYFVFDFSRKMFVMLYSINWPHLIVWLLLLLEILDNMWITIVCFPGCGDINFESNLILPNKSFFWNIKKSIQKFKHLEKEKRFQRQIKSIFYLFKRIFNCQKLYRTRECVFKYFAANAVYLTFYSVWSASWLPFF